jgi:hypothetical protein
VLYLSSDVNAITDSCLSFSEDALKLCRPHPSEVSMSAIWDSTVRKQTNDKISTHELNTKRSELLVPGESLCQAQHDKCHDIAWKHHFGI